MQHGNPAVGEDEAGARYRGARRMADNTVSTVQRLQERVYWHDNNMLQITTTHARLSRSTHPDLSSTQSLKLDARYLLQITNVRQTQRDATNAHNDAVVVRHIERRSHLHAVIYGPPCESVTQLLAPTLLRHKVHRESC